MARRASSADSARSSWTNDVHSGPCSPLPRAAGHLARGWFVGADMTGDSPQADGLVPRLPLGRVGLNAALAVLLAYVYGNDLLDAVRAKGSEVAALAALPSLPF